MQRTDCQCIASKLEPRWDEYRDAETYWLAVNDWRRNWERESTEHTRRCPLSAWYEPTPEDIDEVYQNSISIGRNE